MKQKQKRGISPQIRVGTKSEDQPAEILERHLLRGKHPLLSKHKHPIMSDGPNPILSGERHLLKGDSPCSPKRITGELSRLAEVCRRTDGMPHLTPKKKSKGLLGKRIHPLNKIGADSGVEG